nr:hypothetical protein [Tanacetum cinerariifolium]
MSSIPPMTSPIIDLTSRPESPKVHQQFKATSTETTTTTTTLPPPPYQQQSTTEAMMMKRIGELEHIMANLIQENKGLEERLDKHKARLYTLKQLDIPHQVSKAISEVVTEAVEWAMQAPLQNRFRDLPEADMKEILHQRITRTRLGLSTQEEEKESRVTKNATWVSTSSATSSSSTSRTIQSFRSSWSFWILPSASTTTSTFIHQLRKPSISLTHADLQMDEDMALDEQAQSSNEEDIGSAHIPKTDDIATFMQWFCKRRGITELKPQDLEGPAFEIVKVFHLDVIHLQYQMEECHKLKTWKALHLKSSKSFILIKPLPLGGPPGQVTIQSDFFFNKDLEYLRYGSKDQFWIKEECKYDIAAMYGISHWWFQRQRFYIDRHTSEGDRSAVRTHMRILSVVRIEVFSMYGYEYMKKIVLRRVDLNEQVIVERDFKYLYPSDFEDLYLLNLQEDFQLGIESYQTQLNLTKPRWDATCFEYKHDYTVIDSLRAVTFQDKYEVQMMMRFNEIHKFSDSTFQQIDEALDYRVKEFRINRMNLGLNTRFWTRKDVDRSKAFMFAIQKRLKTRRIFRNLESFIGGRVRDGDYRLLKRIE